MKMRGFYWYLRPMFILAKLFGVLPLQNVHCSDGLKLHFRYMSFAHLYSTIVFVTVLSAFIHTSNLIINTINYPEKNQEAHTWNLIVIYVITVRSSLCFIFCVHNSKKLPNLIQKLEIYEKNKYQLIKKQNFAKEIFRRSIMPFLNGSFYVVASYFEMQAFLKATLRTTLKDAFQGQKAAIIFGVLSDWQVVPLLLYLYFAHTITFNFKSINKELSSHCNFKEIEPKPAENSQNLLEVLQKARHLHTLMSSAVIETSHCYGSFMAIDQVCIIIMFVVNLYVFIFISYDNFHLLVCTLINGILILGIIMMSHEIKVSVSLIFFKKFEFLKLKFF